jgi:hypothetical protein
MFRFRSLIVGLFPGLVALLVLTLALAGAPRPKQQFSDGAEPVEQIYSPVEGTHSVARVWNETESTGSSTRRCRSKGSTN